MPRRSPQDPLPSRVPAALAAALGVEPGEVFREDRDPAGPAFILISSGYRFVTQWSGQPAAPKVAELAATAVEAARSKQEVPLVAAPYLGETARSAVESTGASWIDLSGNARISAPGLRVVILGHKNAFVKPGRPSSVFAPMSSRVARLLLTRYPEGFTQREIARLTRLGEGFVSRICSRLRAQGYVSRDAGGLVRVPAPDVLLDAWREWYDFGRHTIIRGYVVARSGPDLMERLGTALREHRVEHAVTGLGAAWCYAPFADFRTVTIYLASEASDELRDVIGFRDEPRGANTWLVVPDDDGVFDGSAERDGIRCVHPVQVYLDLKGHPERAKEAAAELRASLLKWDRRDR